MLQVLLEDAALALKARCGCVSAADGVGLVGGGRLARRRGMRRGLGLAGRRRGRGGVVTVARGPCRGRGLGLGSRRRGRGGLMALARGRCRGLPRGLGFPRRCRGRGRVIAARVLHLSAGGQDRVARQGQEISAGYASQRRPGILIRRALAPSRASLIGTARGSIKLWQLSGIQA